MKVAHWIREGQMQVLDKHVKSGDINIIYRTYIEGWGQQYASHIVQQIIDFSADTVDVFIASSDGIAAGVIDVMVDNDIMNYPVITGQDASMQALVYIEEGKQSMTIHKPFEELAKIAALKITDLIEGKKVDYDTLLFNGREDVRSVLLNTSIVDRTNNEAIAME